MGARYAHLPIANIGSDSPIGMLDVMYSRHLISSRHALWVSSGSKPDLGGAEDDENELWSEELEVPTIFSAGYYKTVSIDLHIYGLTIAAILNAPTLDTQGLTGMMGMNDASSSSSTSTSFFQNINSSNKTGSGGENISLKSNSNINSLAHDSISSGAFRILFQLVQQLIRDVYSSAHADALLVHLYRWLCTKSSLLYDPSLHRLVFILMHSLFNRLIAEFRKLGCEIIFGNFNKLIISTNKTDLGSATEYINFALNTIKTIDEFKLLRIQVGGMWDQLLFLDELNFGGIPLIHNQTDNEPEEEDEDSEVIEVEMDNNDEEDEVEFDGGESEEKSKETGGDLLSNVNYDDGEMFKQQQVDEDKIGVEMNPPVHQWHIVSSLPDAVKDCFFMMVTEIFYKYNVYKEELEEDQILQKDRLKILIKDSENSAMDIQEDQSEIFSLIMSESEKNLVLMERLRESMESNFTPKLLDFVQEISQFSNQLKDELGSKAAKEIPLEFVKVFIFFVC